MYRASLIAKYVITREADDGRSVSNLRLQKLLYFIQASFIQQKKEPCFFEEFYAWDYGPVIPTVYREYKVYGSASIPPQRFGDSALKIKTEDKRIINETLDICKDYSTNQLVSITHKQDPWKKAFARFPGSLISNDSIQDFFGGTQ